MDNFGQTKVFGSGLEKSMNPDPVCTERLTQDPVNIITGSKPYSLGNNSVIELAYLNML